MNSQNIIWKTDINDAVTVSAEKRKPLLIFFTSQNVSPQLQNEIFATLKMDEVIRRGDFCAFWILMIRSSLKN